jgi:hypothetical protein
MARTRGLLIDNSGSIGSIYTNLGRSWQADPSHTVAAVTSKQGVISYKSPGQYISKVNDTVGWRSPNYVYLYQIVGLCKGNKATDLPYPTGSSIVVNIKQSSSGQYWFNSQSVATLTIPAGSTSATINTTIQLNRGDTIFADIVQIGSKTAGMGLTLYYSYY